MSGKSRMKSIARAGDHDSCELFSIDKYQPSLITHSDVQGVGEERVSTI